MVLVGLAAKNAILIVEFARDIELEGRDRLEAVIAAKAERPDVVVLDLNMPVMDGFRAAREIRDHYLAPPPVLVAASALSANSVQQRLDECGFDYFLTKPADIDRLLSIVEQAGEGTRSGA